MQILTLIGIALLAAAVTFLANWLTLIPWRRSQGRHWTERARVLYPVRATAGSNLWALPAIAAIADVLWFPENSPHWALVLLFGAIGAILGTIPMNREVFPRLSRRVLLRQGIITWLIRFLLWFLIIGAAAIMPDKFNFQCILIAAAVVGLLLLWSQKGWIWLSLKTGRIAPAPERLQEIVRTTAAKMKTPCDEILLIRTPIAQAYAFPDRRCVLFTERLLEILSDEEIAAITAHELGHLMEPRSRWLKRYIRWLTFLPWIFVKPLSEAMGPLAISALIIVSAIASLAFRRIAHAMEVQADTTAHAHAPDPVVYACALTKLYEDNLSPAVNPKRRTTHPSLYDRLIAAGVTPDYPRPMPPDKMTIHGVILTVILGLLLVGLLNHLFPPGTLFR